MRRTTMPFTALGVTLGLALPVAADDPNAPGPTLTELMAIHTVGVNHELGRYGRIDLDQAATSYLRAARFGYPDAQNDLAKLYEDGRGVRTDVVEAYVWYTLAAQGGNAGAGVNRSRLVRRMTAQERLEAERRLQDRAAAASP